MCIYLSPASFSVLQHHITEVYLDETFRIFGLYLSTELFAYLVYCVLCSGAALAHIHGVRKVRKKHSWRTVYKNEPNSRLCIVQAFSIHRRSEMFCMASICYCWSFHSLLKVKEGRKLLESREVGRNISWNSRFTFMYYALCSWMAKLPRLLVEWLQSGA